MAQWKGRGQGQHRRDRQGLGAARSPRTGDGELRAGMAARAHGEDKSPGRRLGTCSEVGNASRSRTLLRTLLAQQAPARLPQQQNPTGLTRLCQPMAQEGPIPVPPGKDHCLSHWVGGGVAGARAGLIPRWSQKEPQAPQLQFELMLMPQHQCSEQRGAAAFGQPLNPHPTEGHTVLARTRASRAHPPALPPSPLCLHQPQLPGYLLFVPPKPWWRGAARAPLRRAHAAVPLSLQKQQPLRRNPPWHGRAHSG